MEVIKAFLEQQPMMALFLTIALGYLLGEINIKGFSLGVGAVLFVAIFQWFDEPPRPTCKPDGSYRRAAGGHSESCVCEDDRGQARSWTRVIRGIRNQHTDAAGGYRGST